MEKKKKKNPINHETLITERMGLHGGKGHHNHRHRWRGVAFSHGVLHSKPAFARGYQTVQTLAYFFSSSW